MASLSALVAAFDGKGVAAADALSDADRTAALRAAVAKAVSAPEDDVKEDDLAKVAELVLFVQRSGGSLADYDAEKGVTAFVRAAAVAVATKDAGDDKDAKTAALNELGMDDFVTAATEPAVHEALQALKAVEAAAAEVDAAGEDEEAKAAAQAKYDDLLAKYVTALDAVEAAEKSAASDKQAAADDTAAAQKDLDAAKAAPAEEKPAAEAEPAPAPAASEPSANVREIAAEPYATLLQKRADALARLRLLCNVFTDVAQNDAKVTDFVSKFASAWDDEIAELQKTVDYCETQYQSIAGQPPNLLPDDAFAVSEVSSLFATLKSKRDGVEAAVNKDRESRADFDEKLVEFNKERDRLLLWCRQEKSNLDGIADVDAVQEFCATLLDHSPAMEANLAVLLEMAEPLLPSPIVQAALLEANEVWLNLHIAAYERLRKTLLEVHERAKLEEEVRAYAGYSEQSLEYVTSVLKLLGEPATAESAELVADLVRDGRDLKAELEGDHKQLPALLRDFALRMEGFRDNYNNIRKSVFARLTFLASSVPTLTTSVRRKEEYRDHMASLQRWVQAKSRGESWADIRGRVERLRSMVADEKAAMAREEPLSSETQDAAAS